MQTLQFDTHLGQFYSLARIRIDPPSLKFLKISYLNCHLLCALDTSLNLHFIQFREPTEQDPQIYPPYYSFSNTSKIFFTIETLTLVRETRENGLKEKDFTEFFVKLDYLWENEPEICVIKPGAFLYKPIKNGAVYLLDLTVLNSKPKLVHHLTDVHTLSLWNESIAVFSSRTLDGVFMEHLYTEKIKKLNFTKSQPCTIRTINKEDLCVAVFDDVLEVLDLKTNKVIERFLFESFSENAISVSPNGTRMIHTYLYGKPLDGNMYMDIWDIAKNRKLSKRDPFHLDNALQNEHYVEFLNETLVVHVRRWQFDIFKIEDYGIVKLHSFDIPYNYGLIKSSEDGHCIWSHLSITVIDPKTFLLLTSDVYEDGYNRIESYHIDAQDMKYTSRFDVDYRSSTSQNENFSLQNLERQRSLQDKLTILTNLNAKTKLVFLEKVDFINSVCTWQSHKVGILYDSYRFYEYNLLNGKLLKITNLTGLKDWKENLKKISYVDENHLAIFYQREEDLKLRLVVINLQLQQKAFDTKKLTTDNHIKSFNFIEIIDESVFFIYKKQHSNDGFLGKLDLKTKDITDVFQVESHKRIDDIWDLGDHYMAGRCRHSKDTLRVWDLRSNKLVLEKKFSRQGESREIEPIEVLFWSVTKINCEIIAFLSRGIVSTESAVVIYNWKKDRILNKCEVKAEEILGFLNNEVFVLLEDYFPENSDTFYATISIRKALTNTEDRNIVKLGYKRFGKFFMELEKSSFQCLSNKKQAVLAIKGLFPHDVFIMRKRNKRLELLRHIKRELTGHYHPYLVKDVVKMIVGEEYVP